MTRDDIINALAMHAALTSDLLSDSEITERADTFAAAMRKYVDDRKPSKFDIRDFALSYKMANAWIEAEKKAKKPLPEDQIRVVYVDPHHVDVSAHTIGEYRSFVRVEVESPPILKKDA